MDEIKTKTNILIDILLKKQKTLEEILNLTINQSTVLGHKPIDFRIFDKLLEEKRVRIEKINSLDEGFSGIYDSIKDIIKDNTNNFAKEIKKMQDLIYKISDTGVKINIEEEKNRKILSNNSLKEKTKAIEVYRQNISSYKKSIFKMY